jgi:actin-related protein 5
VPEVVFQPSIAGVDQAGLTEIAEDILMQRLVNDISAANAAKNNTSVAARVSKDIFLTGGYSMFQGFEERLRSELRSVLPAEIELGVRRAKDPILDAWKGAAKWASTKESRNTFVSKAEWAEKGGDYIKEHNLGNVYS